ncbi:MAG: hypothetical protein J6D46_03555, partial [Lachnospiraceae bacterium]|nr:hypothetical protein [Lachnospiraceae bacterium]
MKREIALLSAVCLLAGTPARGQESAVNETGGRASYTTYSGAETAAPESTPPYIVVTGDPLVPELVEKYYPGYIPEVSVTSPESAEDGFSFASGRISDTEIMWYIGKNDEAYYENLDVSLVDQSTGERMGLVDLFVVDVDMADKYVSADADVAGALRSDLKITNTELSEQFEYTRTITSDENGVQRGVMVAATPGFFAYRRSIAKDVLGTDDPEKVQQAVADWESFDQTAAKMHDRGWKMLAGAGDAFECVEQNKEIGWYDEQGDLHIAESLQDWIASTKEYSEKGYNAGNYMWTDAWHAETGKNGKTFGFFISADEIAPFISGALDKSFSDGGEAAEGNGSFGDWAVCTGPGHWYRGGSVVCAAAGSPYTELSANLIRFLACDEGTMMEMAGKENLCVNNKAVLRKLSDAKDQGEGFLTSLFQRGVCGRSVAGRLLEEAEEAGTVREQRETEKAGSVREQRETEEAGTVQEQREAEEAGTVHEEREADPQPAQGAGSGSRTVPVARTVFSRKDPIHPVLLSAGSAVSLTEEGTEENGNEGQPAGGADAAAGDA